jgi:hypothetical protein
MKLLAPGIRGSVGNATYQLARAQGAGKLISTAGSSLLKFEARGAGVQRENHATASHAAARRWISVSPISAFSRTGWPQTLLAQATARANPRKTLTRLH